MADFTVTAASVKPTATTNTQTKLAGVTITAGQALYLDANDVLQLSRTNAANTAGCVGIALNGAAQGQPVQYATGGDVTFNAGFTAGAVAVASAAVAGNLAPVADLVSTNLLTFVGYATSTTNVRLLIVPSAVAKA